MQPVPLKSAFCLLFTLIRSGSVVAQGAPGLLLVEPVASRILDKERSREAGVGSYSDSSAVSLKEVGGGGMV